MATLYDVSPERKEISNGEGEGKGSRTGGFITEGRGGHMAEIAAVRAMIAVARAVLSTGGREAVAGATDLAIVYRMICW